MTWLAACPLIKSARISDSSRDRLFSVGSGFSKIRDDKPAFPSTSERRLKLVLERCLAYLTYLIAYFVPQPAHTYTGKRPYTYLKISLNQGQARDAPI